jgi:outer membrane protein TolC
MALNFRIRVLSIFLVLVAFARVSFAENLVPAPAATSSAQPSSSGPTPVPTVGSSEARLTLADAILKGEEQSPELRRLKLAAQGAGWKRLEAISTYIPQVSVNSTYFLGTQYPQASFLLNGGQVSFPSAYPQTNIVVDASWTFFDGFGAWNLYHAAILSHEAAKFDYEHEKFKLDQNIRVKFFEALGAEELALVADQNIQTLEHHLELVEVSERAGTGTRVDVLRVQAELAEARAEKILAHDHAALAKLSLSEVMGVEEYFEKLEGSLPMPSEERIASGLQLNLAARPDYQAQLKRESAADRVNAASGAFWLPRISLFAMEQFYSYNGTFSPVILASSGLQSAYGFGLRLNWNLFDGGSSIAKSAQAEVQARQSTESSHGFKLSATTDFETWKRRYIYNSHLFKARQRSVEQNEESIRLAIVSVKEGTKTHSEFLDAERDLFRARAGVIQAQLAALEAFSRLEVALGYNL